MKLELPKVIFSFFGPPGSGKGTLGERLKRELDFEILSTGNLCRFHVAQQTAFGKELEQYINRGQLIPDSLITRMVQDWLIEKVKRGMPIILDGFPRTGGQAEVFLRSVATLPGYSFRVIMIELSDDEIVRRLSARRVCSNKECQAIYNAAFAANQCSHCGAPLARREDDQEEVIRERLKLYPAYKASLLAMYEKLGQQVESLDVAGMSAEEVLTAFKSIL